VDTCCPICGALLEVKPNGQTTMNHKEFCQEDTIEAAGDHPRYYHSTSFQSLRDSIGVYPTDTWHGFDKENC